MRLGPRLGSIAVLALLLLAGPVSTDQSVRIAAGGVLDPAANEAAMRHAVVPVRDLYSLARRLRGVDLGPAPGPEEIVGVPPRLQGERASFQVADMVGHSYSPVDATLELVSDHAYWFIADGQSLDREALSAAATTFEERVYPTNRRYFGSEWNPGIDGDPRIYVLATPLRGAGGYFSSVDEHPRAVSPYSNEHEIIYVGSRPGAPGFLATLAHEFQHMIHWHEHPNEDIWLNEGAAELAMELNGFSTGGVAGAFQRAPETQLNAWASQPGAALAHYGAAYLFLSYLVQQDGGADLMGELVRNAATGARGLDEVLSARGYADGFDGAFRYWAMANLIDDGTVADGRYAYASLPEGVAPARELSDPGLETDGLVPQYAAAYIKVPEAASGQRLHFAGAATTRIIGTDACQGTHFWWSNRGDMGDTTLTRELDLRGVDRASLSFCLWHDIETGFDYGYVEVSTDGGRTWQTLPGAHTTDANPNGNSLGHAFTGQSGNAQPGGSGWETEAMDLTPFAGGRIQLRFEYVTDDGYNGAGMAVDEIHVPEIGFYDGGETDQGWDAAGFLRTSNVIPQRYSVQLAEFAPGGTVVSPLPLDEANQGWLDLATDPVPRVLMVAPMAYQTTERAPLHVWVSPAPAGATWPWLRALVAQPAP